MAGRFQDPEASLAPFGCLMPTDYAFHSTARPLLSLLQPPRVQSPVSHEVQLLLGGLREALVPLVVSTCSEAPYWGLQHPPYCFHPHRVGRHRWSGRSARLVPRCWEGGQGQDPG